MYLYSPHKYRRSRWLLIVRIQTFIEFAQYIFGIGANTMVVELNNEKAVPHRF